MINKPVTPQQLQKILHFILQQQPEQQRQKIGKILQDQQETEEQKFRRILRIRREQQPQTQQQQAIILQILEDERLTTNDAKVNKIVGRFQILQPRVPKILYLLLDPKLTTNNVRSDKILLELQDLQDQQILEIVKILQLLQTTITEDVISEADSVIKSLVQEINSSKKLREIQIINQKLEKLMDLKKVFHNSSNSDSIKTIVNEFINHTSASPQVDEDDQGKALITNAARYLYLLRNSSQSLEKGKINDPALGLELFRIYRSKIEHEDTVLNQRINWFLVTQGFLFAAFATALTAEIDIIIIVVFLLVISITGFGYTLLISNPILSSFIAIDTIKEEWKMRVKQELTTEQVNQLFPEQVCFDPEETIYLPSNCQTQLKSQTYKNNTENIIKGTKIIWLISLISILLVVISCLLSYLSKSNPIPVFFEPHHLKIKTSNHIQDRFSINTEKEKLGLTAAICSFKGSKVLAIKPKKKSFYNLSQNLAEKYESLAVPVSSNTDNKPLIEVQSGKLEDCVE